MAHQPPIHRNGDPRNCGATTTVLNQTSVPDNICPIPPHCNPQTAGGSPNVFVAD